LPISNSLAHAPADQTVVLDEHGIARELSLPLNGASFTSPLVTIYRVRNGVLHTPRATGVPPKEPSTHRGRPARAGRQAGRPASEPSPSCSTMAITRRRI